MPTISPNTMKRLAFIRVLFLQGLDQTKRPEPFSALGLLSLHDAIELWLILAGEHLGATLPKDMRFLDYWDKFKPKLPNGRELGSKTAMARLNTLRVGLKHHGTVPSITDIEQLRADVTTFFRDSTALVFDRDFDRLTMTDLVVQPSVHPLVAEAEQAALDEDWTSALAALQRAFEELNLDYSKRKRSSRDKGPFQFGEHFSFASFKVNQIQRTDRRLGELLGNLYEAVEAMQTPLQVLATGLDYRRYAQFSLRGPQVFRTMDGQWHISPVPGLTLSRDDYDFAYQFVVEASLRLAELDFDLDIPAIVAAEANHAGPGAPLS